MKKLAILGTGDAETPDATTPAPILAAATDFRPELCPVPDAVFPDTPAARETCARAYLNAGVSAERDGYAGLYINTVGDYGLADLRDVSGVPVTGSGEGAIRTAQADGHRFAIVTIWPPALRFIYDAILAATDAAHDCLAIYHLSEDPDLATLKQPDNFVQDMQACGMTTMAKIHEACRRGLDDDGADVILLGCTCMQSTAALLEADGLPVIEPMVAGYRYLESLIKGSV
ncbi:MAG: aspartate/glutamate racemase family protein [Gammaproteobacteria bacterium]|nr:aspartate/glutamate racemase family protein [Gammaproteobacteria bacterium]